VRKQNHRGVRPSRFTKSVDAGDRDAMMSNTVVHRKSSRIVPPEG